MRRSMLGLCLAIAVSIVPTADAWAVEEPAEVAAASTRPEVQLVDPGSEPRQVLSYTLTEGQTDLIDLTTSGASRATMPGGSSPWFEIPAFVSTAEQTVVAANEDGTYDIEAIVTGVEVVDTVDDPAMADAYQDQLGALVGMSTRYRIDEHGRVLASETITTPGAAATALQPGLIDTTSLQVTQPLPAEPVGLGAVWKVTSELADPGTGLSITFVNTTKLERLHADGSFELSGEIVIASPLQQMSVPGMPDDLTLTSQADGAISAHWIIDPTRVGVEVDGTAAVAMTVTTTRDGESESDTMEMRMEMRSERGTPSTAPRATPPIDARVIELEADAALRFLQDGEEVRDIPVVPGETILLRIDNTAGFDHSFYIGTDEELSVMAGTTATGIPDWSSGVRELTWVVPDDISGLRFGCTVPGHYALMYGCFSEARIGPDGRVARLPVGELCAPPEGPDLGWQETQEYTPDPTLGLEDAFTRGGDWEVHGGGSSVMVEYWGLDAMQDLVDAVGKEPNDVRFAIGSTVNQPLDDMLNVNLAAVRVVGTPADMLVEPLVRIMFGMPLDE